MQSGIQVSQELSDRFGEFVSNPAEFGLLVTIENEHLVQKGQVLSTADGAATTEARFGANLRQLAPHLTADGAVYVLLRRWATAPELVVVTYVPDGAPVRQKMLYASSRLGLVRTLGSEHFRRSVTANDAAELTAEGWAAAEAHAAVAAPLTAAERSLGEVRQAESEAGAAAEPRPMHMARRLAVPLATDSVAALKAMAADDGVDLVVLRINPGNETVELAPEGAGVTSIPALSRALAADEPRYAFYRHRTAAAGSPILFVYSCPTTVAAGAAGAIKTRMMYPLMKRAVLDAATAQAGLQVDHTFEVGDPAEITVALVDDELSPKEGAKQTFSRPKRPGR